MVCILFTWWKSSEVMLVNNPFIYNDPFTVSQVCWLDGNFWRGLGVGVRWPSSTSGISRGKMKNTQISSSKNIYRENYSKISGTFTWEESHSVIIDTLTVRYSLSKALTSASLESYSPFLVSRCLSQKIHHQHGVWSDGSSLLLYTSLQMVLHWTWLFSSHGGSPSLGTV